MGYTTKIKIPGLLFLLITAMGCSPMRLLNRTEQLPDRPLFLPGVDSLVAMQSYVVARQLLPPDAIRADAEQLRLQGQRYFSVTDSLLVGWQKMMDSSQTKTAHDTTFFQIICRKAILFAEGKRRLVNLKKLGMPTDIPDIITSLYEKASQITGQAIELNPYDIHSWILSSRIWMARARWTQKEKYYRQALQTVRNVLEYNRSLPDMYILMGECHQALRQWQEAYIAYSKAQQLIEATAFFRPDTTLDDERMVFLLQQRAHVCARQYDDSTALALLQQARRLTTDAATQADIDRYIKWISWDDGNIRAVEERDAIYQLYRKGDYKQANRRYKKLIHMLTTSRTKNFINWKIALIDFSILDRREEGIARMHQVIRNLNPDADSDSMCQVYRNDYGAMCFAMGAEYLTKKNYKLAYTYFYQAAAIKWKGQGKSALELAKLAVVDPQLTIRHCRQALDHADQLSRAEKNQLYELLTHACKSNGQFELARNYHLRLTHQ